MRALPAEDMGKHRAQLKALEALLLGASLWAPRLEMGTWQENEGNKNGKS